VIEAVMFWNEPNNMSHWDFGVDPDWSIFASMVRTAGAAVAAECPGLTRVLGGISPIDAGFVGNMDPRACSAQSTSWRCTGSRLTGTTG
jgi:beta-xylosidase